LLEKYSKTITNKLNTGVLLLDSQLNIVMWNRFLEIHTNKKPEKVIGESVFSIFPELPKRWFERKVSGVIQLKTPSFCSWEQRHHLFELPHTRPITTGSDFMAQNCTFFPLEEDDAAGFVCILIEDVTDVCYYQTMLNKAMQELELANRIDGLTQIFNRKHWEGCLEQEFSRARRYAHPLSLIMLDLDHFKLLNDTYGHQGGDKVLIEISNLVTSLLRLGDIFGRYGGEEFAVILPETNLQGAAEVAERLRKKISELSILFSEKTITTSISIGVAEMSKDDNNYEDLISNADVALYRAKSSGRDRLCLAKESA
jgi:diguanylate cyclase (GGDEF)-like protein